MMPEIDKRLVAMRFGQRTLDYDAVTPVQRSMQDELLSRAVDRIGGRSVRRILELGCGTGGLTAKLIERFPQARVVVVDLAAEMVDHVRGKGMPVDAVVADAEEYVRRDTGRYDLVISNATAQWFTDPRETIQVCRELVGTDGVVAFTTFGDRTFHELSASFTEAYDHMGLIPVPHVLPLASAADWQAWSSDVDVDQKELICMFSDVRSFLRSVQLAGASLSAGTPRPISRRVLARMMSCYEERFPAIATAGGIGSGGGVRATYHALTIIARGSTGDDCDVGAGS
jgi:malonyl-CoA O-methyltransferase